MNDQNSFLQGLDIVCSLKTTCSAGSAMNWTAIAEIKLGVIQYFFIAIFFSFCCFFKFVLLILVKVLNIFTLAKVFQQFFFHLIETCWNLLDLIEAQILKLLIYEHILLKLIYNNSNQENMPRQLVTIQVGQCGNQIGLRFWQLLLKQHSKFNQKGIYDDALSSFFRNTDNDGNTLSIGSQISQLKARAVCIDMEPGVTNMIKSSQYGQLFDNFINDTSGAGNNWAHGFYQYGAKYEEVIYQSVNKAVQQCDSIQSFFLIHSLGGGTGSGLGTYTLGLLQDRFPDIFRFTASVFPSIQNDDVNVSPYNSMFSLYQIMKHSDCSLPIDNQALVKIVDTVEEMANKSKGNQKQVVKGTQITGTKKKAYDKMNTIIANLLSNLTCSMRFQGILNVDFNQITMNLVPYPDLHFLISSMAPLYNIADPRLQPRKLDQIFHDIYDQKYQIIQSNPFNSTYLAMGLIFRGKVSFSDVNKNIKSLKQKKNLKFIHWNSQGFKYGICNTPPHNQDYSLLCLANNTCIKDRFKVMRDKYWTLYKRKLYTHTYQQYMGNLGHFDQTLEAVDSIIAKYKSIQNSEPKPIKRLKPLYL